jgi:hypothetical protein
VYGRGYSAQSCLPSDRVRGLQPQHDEFESKGRRHRCVFPSRPMDSATTIIQLGMFCYGKNLTYIYLRSLPNIAVYLQSEFQQFYREFADFINSSPVMEILQPLPALSMTASKHVDCCPSSPFIPHFFQYPPAGILHLLIQCFKAWMRFSLYPSLCAELECEPKVPDLQNAPFYSFELCRTFAGIERQFDHNNAVIFPCFVPMIMAALNCSPNVRPWMLAKLRHFKEHGQICHDSIKKSLAVLWNMPEIATEGFGVSLRDNSLDVPVIDEFVDITVVLENVDLNHEEENIEDIGLEELTQLRGLFGLQDE